jgi:molybdopterin-containing oxidoreductase family iron-sulfur binding subunit
MGEARSTTRSLGLGASAPEDVRLWRSCEERGTADADSCAAEFAAPMQTESLDRRSVLRVMAASLALAGTAGCGKPQAPLLSLPRSEFQPGPGPSVRFATSIDLDGYGRGVLVDVADGRPVKIEGNPLHPATLGATDVFAQAEVLSLYDPDRSRAPLQQGAERRWAEADGLLLSLRRELLARGGEGCRILMSPMASPTRERLVRAVAQAMPGIRWHRYGPIVGDTERAGAILAFGRPVEQVYALGDADVIVTLGGDLFAEAPGHIRYAADFMRRRRATDRPLPRFYSVETRPSLAGLRADRRLVLLPHEIEDFARELLRRLRADAAGDATSDAGRIARDLAAAGRRGLVVPGREQPAIVHALCHAINGHIGAPGSTLRYIAPVLRSDMGEMESLVELSQALAAGAVRTLIVLGANPAYAAPPGLDFERLIPKVPQTLHVGQHVDETATLCRWHIPELHALESWGDLRAFEGTAGIRQPATVPLMQGMTAEEVLGMLSGEGREARALVQATWRAAWGEAFDERWPQVLEAGVVANSEAEPVSVALRDFAIEQAIAARPPFTVLFAPDPTIWDGRFANNAWLQELPKPLTKQVWGNAALMSPATAEAYGLRTGDVVELRGAEGFIEAPVFALPGHAPDSATLTLGLGRKRAGRVGNLVGFNATALRSAADPWVRTDVVISPAGRRADLVTTQHHHTMAGRDIVRVVSAPTKEVAASGPYPSFYPEWNYPRRAWAMAIDLDACIGCNACVVACQAENNVAVVGPDEVARGREMHWLRIDRYFSGPLGDPRVYFQPMPCMHCEKAPCEVVCPVNATVHDSEGLNQMVYNRCIGTRTCSNNCPYKVRRFNWFDYTDSRHAVPEAVHNPQVTVRERGVMEKCTYCIQRIWTARIEAGMDNRPLAGDAVVTACQQACPAHAIVFGDLNDPASAVSAARRSPRHYALLGELNTQPRTTYLARIESGASRQADDSG